MSQANWVGGNVRALLTSEPPPTPAATAAVRWFSGSIGAASRWAAGVASTPSKMPVVRAHGVGTICAASKFKYRLPTQRVCRQVELLEVVFAGPGLPMLAATVSMVANGSL